jgi:hypothetical protein
MKDIEFLLWLRERLINVHHENPNFDYMHKLTAIINGYDPNKVTPNIGEELKECLTRQ